MRLNSYLIIIKLDGTFLVSHPLSTDSEVQAGINAGRSIERIRMRLAYATDEAGAIEQARTAEDTRVQQVAAGLL